MRGAGVVAWVADLLVVAAEAPERWDEPEPQQSPEVRWWAPYLCRVQGSVIINGQRRPGRCRSRGCLECHQSKLSRMMETAALVKALPGEVLRTFVLTPEAPVRTREDVADFLASVRGLLRAWEQRYGLGAAWWVAEVVRKPDWERTAIPCPMRDTPLPEEVADRLAPRSLGVLDEARMACLSGEACAMCGGTGTLPGVHLHAHVVAVCRPFWYGRGSPPAGSTFEDFAGRGYRGLGDEFRLGWSGVQKLRSRGGLAAYVSKAARKYLSKGQKSGKREVDWQASQLDTQLASAVYGRRRHRGTNGRAYGLGAAVRDVTQRVTFSPSCVSGEASPATAALWGWYPGLRAATARRAAVEGAVSGGASRSEAPLFVRVLTVGRRTARAGGFGRAAALLAGARGSAEKGVPKGQAEVGGGLKVLRGTQVARSATGERSEARGPSGGRAGADVWVHRDDGSVALAPRAQDADGLAVQHRGGAVVGAGQWWSVDTPHGLLVGRGATAALARGVPRSEAAAVVDYLRLTDELWRLGCCVPEAYPLGVWAPWWEVVGELGAHDSPARE